MTQYRFTKSAPYYLVLVLCLAGCKSADENLSAAIMRDDGPGVTKALSRGADINSCNNKGWSKPSQGLTPLGVALSSQREHAALALIAAGADVNRRDYRTQAPLGYALEYGNLQVVEAVLQTGADPNAVVMTDRFLGAGQTPLIEAVQHQKPDEVEALLKHKANPNLTDRWVCSALWHARGKLPSAELAKLDPGILQIRELLLRAGAKPDPRDLKGRTWLTVQQKNIDHENKADEDIGKKMLAATEGRAFEELQVSKRPSVPIKFRLTNASKATNKAAQARLYQAIEKADAVAVREALKTGAAIDAQFEKAATNKYYEYETPLIVAIELGHAEIVSLLLNAGANPMASGSNWPPLHHAARKGSSPMVSALLDKGANPNFGTLGVGETALMHAAGSGSVGSVKLLLAYGVDPDARTNEGTSTSTFLFMNKEAISKILKQASQNRRKKSPVLKREPV